MKKYLMKRMQRLNEKKQSLAERAKASEDIAEVRSLTAQIEEINNDIADIQEQLDALEENNTRGEAPAQAQTVNANIVNGHVVATSAQRA